VVTFLFTDVEVSTRRWEADADLMRKALAAHDEVLRSAIEGHGGWLFKHALWSPCVSSKQPIHGPNQLPKGIAVKQPELTQLIGLQDGDGDRVFISRLDRPDGSRGYLLAIRSGEVHGGVSLTAGDLDRLSTVIRHEVGEGDDDLMAEFRFFARAIWLLIFCALMSLLLFAVTGPLFAYPWSN
jgi:class 3 adenylate cyclase